MHGPFKDETLPSLTSARGKPRNNREGLHPRKVEVSKIEEVSNFYERLPYPAPLTSLDEHSELYKNPARRQRFI
jgi:hypothetical protein